MKAQLYITLTRKDVEELIKRHYAVFGEVSVGGLMSLEDDVSVYLTSHTVPLAANTPRDIYNSFVKQSSDDIIT